MNQQTIKKELTRNIIRQYIRLFISNDYDATIQKRSNTYKVIIKMSQYEGLQHLINVRFLTAFNDYGYKTNFIEVNNDSISITFEKGA